MSRDPAADLSVEVAELSRQIGVIDADITLVNEQLNETQGMFSAFLIYYRKNQEEHNGNVICLDYRRSCCRGSPEVGTCLGQGTSSG